MSETILRRFLRYEVPVYLMFFYWMFLLLPFINLNVLLPSNDSNPVIPFLQFCVAAVGIFVSSGAIGYLMYQIYDTCDRAHPAEKRRMLNAVLNGRYIRDAEWVKTCKRLRKVCARDEELAQQLINYSLYATSKSEPVDPKALDTLRGFWGHLQARTVGSWAIIPALLLLVISISFLSHVEGLIVLDIHRLLIFLLPLFFSIICSCILCSKRDDIRKRIGRFVSLILRHNLVTLNQMLNNLCLEENR